LLSNVLRPCEVQPILVYYMQGEGPVDRVVSQNEVEHAYTQNIYTVLWCIFYCVFVSMMFVSLNGRGACVA
jgi:hypothetical protein